MPSKFLTIGSTGEQRLTAALTTSAGAGSAGNVIATNSAGQVDSTFLPAGLEISTEAIVASEALAAGDLVNIYSNSGTRTARKADASNSRAANGYVLASVASAGTATVYKSGANTAKTGLTPGAAQYLSATTAGACTTTPSMYPTAQIVQAVGYAASATALQFEFDAPTYLDA